LQEKISNTKLYISCMLMCGGLRVCKCWGRLPNKYSLPAHFLTNTCPGTQWLSESHWLVCRKKEASPFGSKSIPGQNFTNVGSCTIQLKPAIIISAFQNAKESIPNQAGLCHMYPNLAGTVYVATNPRISVCTFRCLYFTENNV